MPETLPSSDIDTTIPAEVLPGIAVVSGEVPAELKLDLVGFGLVPVADLKQISTFLASMGNTATVAGNLGNAFASLQGLDRISDATQALLKAGGTLAVKDGANLGTIISSTSNRATGPSSAFPTSWTLSVPFLRSSAERWRVGGSAGQGGGKDTCPSFAPTVKTGGHPVRIPALTFDIAYGAKGSRAGYCLSSDPGGRSTSSMHGDAFVMWDVEAMSQRVRNCIAQRRTCNNKGYDAFTYEDGQPR